MSGIDYSSKHVSKITLDIKEACFIAVCKIWPILASKLPKNVTVFSRNDHTEGGEGGGFLHCASNILK